MSKEEFDDIVTEAYGKGQFRPKDDDETKILRESQLRLTERKELAIPQAQCQGECHSCE